MTQSCSECGSREIKGLLLHRRDCPKGPRPVRFEAHPFKGDREQMVIDKTLWPKCVCGTPLTKPSRGPLPKFCSNRCRMQAKRAN